MAETCAIVNPVFDQADGVWYLYQKPGFAPMVLLHKNGHHATDIRNCHRQAGWSIRPLTVYSVDTDDID